MVRKLFLSLLVIVFMATCQSTQTGNDEDFVLPPDDASLTTGTEVDGLQEIVQSFNNPVEMAALLKDVGVPFSMKYLCPTNNADDYNTNFKKALGLGVLSVDLGYLNIYNKSSSIINYITVIKRLADGLKIGQFFDFQSIKTLATTSDNLDSLMYLCVNSFNQMDTYLRDNKRSHLSILIVTGMWVEGLYLASQVYKEKPNKDVGERIGEQKIILNEIYQILKKYQTDKNFSGLVKDLEEIKKVFDEVKITYEVGEPQTVEKGGVVTIIQNDKSTVTISAEQLKEITTRTEKIRTKLIQL